MVTGSEIVMDRYEKSRDGIRALAEGERTVQNGGVQINGKMYYGDCLKPIEGQRVKVRVRDYLASHYSVYDLEWRSLGDCYELSRLELRRSRKAVT